jgi:hypothetical protein
MWVSPEQINVEIRLKCEEGESFGMIADVFQQKFGMIAEVFQQKWGVGTASGQCTGGSQYVTIQVRSSATPPWQLGTADAYLNFGTSTAYDSEARTIRIE